MSADQRLEPFVAALREAIDARQEAFRPRPDVCDVVDRALARRAAAVPLGLRDSLPRTHADAEPDRPDPALAAFASALRDRTEAQVRERTLAPIAAPRARTSFRPAVAMVAAIAAAIALWIAVPRWTTLDASEGPAAAPMMGADQSYVPPVSDRVLAHPSDDVGSSPTPAGRIIPSADVIPEEAPALDDAVPLVADPPARTAKSTVVDLETRARAAWQDGDLQEAERLLRRIVRIGGKTRRADLAYGDLFSVVRQRSGRDAQAGVWREYLQHFPRGRFADDARAGLCRRAPGVEANACWQTYLSQHPSGTHAAEARRATEPATP